MIAIEDTTGTWSKIVAIYPFFIFSKNWTLMDWYLTQMTLCI